MSINTSEDYLDELLQAIEPIINPESLKPTEPEIPVSEPEVVEEFVSDAIDISELLSEPGAGEPVLNSNETVVLEDDGDGNVAINDLLASLAEEELDNPDVSEMSEEDVESMLIAANSPVTLETDETYAEDVKELLKQFTEDEDLSDIQDILDKNDNGEALDNSMLELPDVEVFQLEEEDGEENEETDSIAKSSSPIGKLIGGFASLFKKRKNKKHNSTEDETSLEADVTSFEETKYESDEAVEFESDISNVDTLALEEMLGEDVEDLVFDEDLSDIEQLLSGGTLSEVEEYDSDLTSSPKDNSTNGKSGKKEKKKESFLSKILNVLTEEIEEPKKGSVPEAAKTGVSKENLDILEELSAENKKKTKKAKKEEKQSQKTKKNAKNPAKKGDGEAEENGKDSKDKKAKKAKKAKKKLEKKDKPRKVEVITKPEKKLPRKRVLSTLVLCFSIMAGVLILQNVVTKSDNIKEAQFAYDRGDYATCFANLEIVERNEEEEALYQKSMIIMSVQRKWDSYNNFSLMNNETEALNSLLEGVKEYREQEAAAIEWNVHSQITAVYQDILSVLQGYGLSQEDVEEILGYESKVTYTKRLDSIVNGTEFVIDDYMEDSNSSEPQPLQDVLPGEEDFLPEDTALINETSAVTELPEEKPVEVQEIQPSGETVVVGSNPVDVSTQSDVISYDEAVVVGGQNVGSGNMNMSVEVNGQNALIGVQ